MVTPEHRNTARVVLLMWMSLQENELKLFRENHKMEMKKLKDELESMPKEQRRDAYRQLKEEKDIQQAERVSQSVSK